MNPWWEQQYNDGKNKYLASGLQAKPRPIRPSHFSSIITQIGKNNFRDQFLNSVTITRIAYSIHKRMVQLVEQDPKISVFEAASQAMDEHKQQIISISYLDTKQKRAAAIEEGLRQRLPGGIPIELFLAMSLQEMSSLDNEEHSDGVFQVTPASGHHEESGIYVNSRSGIQANVQDAINTLNGFYGRTDDYIRAAWMYNGGNNPYRMYEKGRGDPKYLEHIANRLEREMAVVYGKGYDNPTTKQLIKQLREAQKKVDDKTY